MFRLTEAGSWCAKVRQELLDASPPPRRCWCPAAVGWPGRWRAYVVDTRLAILSFSTLSMTCPIPAAAPGSRCGRPRSADGRPAASMSWPLASTVKACGSIQRVPVGRFTFPAAMALATSSMPIRAGKGLGIKLDPNGIFLGTEDLHLGHAVDHGDALGDERVGIFVRPWTAAGSENSGQDKESAGRPG